MAESTTRTQRLALITGAAGGLGGAMAKALEDEGFALALVDIKVPQNARSRKDLSWFSCDLRDPAAIESLAGQVREACGHPAILINNAGLFPTTPLDELTPEVWREVLAVNLDAPLLLSQAFAPAMREAGWGRIVNIASGVTQIVRRDVAAYIASKMGLIGLTRALASDLGPHGITVNAVSPGLTATANVRAKFEPEGAESIFDQFIRRQAIPAAIEPRDIAAVVCSLVSDSMKMVTGQTILVDGGVSRL